MKTTTIVSTVLLGASLLAGNALADSKYNLVPSGTAKFTPVDPKNPALQMSVVAGDPKTGPVTFFLKLGKGPAPIHWHTSDYSAVVIEGQTKHWLPGKEADAKAGGPGTAWFQPGGSAKEAHGDECLTDSCTVFIVMPKKFDFTAVPPAKETKTPPAKK